MLGSLDGKLGHARLTESQEFATKRPTSGSLPRRSSIITAPQGVEQQAAMLYQPGADGVRHWDLLPDATLQARPHRSEVRSEIPDSDFHEPHGLRLIGFGPLA